MKSKIQSNFQGLSIKDQNSVWNVEFESLNLFGTFRLFWILIFGLGIFAAPATAEAAR